ncbi:MAG: GOLPH3/VPS74 family protein [Thiohalocapsa sp.]
MLSFVEEIVLLRLDDTHGRFVDLPSSASGIVLAGAALMELALRNRVDSDLERLIVVDARPTGDEILDDALAHLAAAPGTRNIAGAIDLISGKADLYQEKALRRLIEKGVLREVDGRFLWVFHTRRYPVVDDSEQREVKARLRELLLGDEIPESRDIALTCLIDACGLLGLVLNAEETHRVAARVEQLDKMDLIGQAMRRAVEEIRFIVSHVAQPMH